jgi:hypothetical protein
MMMMMMMTAYIGSINTCDGRSKGIAALGFTKFYAKRQGLSMGTTFNTIRQE